MWQRSILAALLVTAALALAACGSSSSSSSSSSGSTPTAHLAKTKFVLHAGLAFGAFHRYIYKPYREGKFSGGLLHHKLATVKAALAGAFAYHEVKLALIDARSSRVLSKALAPLLALQAKLGTLTGDFKHGDVDASAIQSANGAAGQTGSASGRAGQPVTDQPTPSF
ncbi:MAG: hypothetical protein WAK93_16640 [Solirubrobacteraceae bacterium]